LHPYISVILEDALVPKVDEVKIAELSRRIEEAVKPNRIILFGSAARGELGPDSDLDVLVVMPDGVHRGRTAEEIYRQLWGFGVAKDIVVVTDSDVLKYSDDPFRVIKCALEEGRELYRAA
jgi:predicted nucleotidyltransferase